MNISLEKWFVTKNNADSFRAKVVSDATPSTKLLNVKTKLKLLRCVMNAVGTGITIQ
jgi:hypothetical protein